MDRYGLRCKKTCPLCENLGICHPKNGSCICSPGFIGTLCDKRKSVYTNVPVVNYTVVFLWLLYLIPLHTVYYQYLCLQLLHEHAPKLRFMFHEIK